MSALKAVKYEGNCFDFEIIDGSILIKNFESETKMEIYPDEIDNLITELSELKKMLEVSES